MSIKLSFSSLACPASTVDQIIEKGKTYGFQGIENFGKYYGFIPAE